MKIRPRKKLLGSRRNSENTDEIVLEHVRKIGASIKLEGICGSHGVGQIHLLQQEEGV